MREIKFRLWLPLERKMTYGFDISDMPDKTQITDAVTHMQYTGLKDKNGKEIYEGDVLKRTELIDGNFVDRVFDWYEVAYNQAIAGFEYKPVRDKRYKQYTTRPFGGSEIEVIGNIYENPELLNP